MTCSLLDSSHTGHSLWNFLTVSNRGSFVFGGAWDFMRRADDPLNGDEPLCPDVVEVFEIPGFISLLSDNDPVLISGCPILISLLAATNTE